MLCALAADGGLTDKNERQGLRTHLKSCPECRQLFRDFYHVIEWLRKAVLHLRWEELRGKCGLADLSASLKKRDAKKHSSDFSK
jgi:hypothetical protein